MDFRRTARAGIAGLSLLASSGCSALMGDGGGLVSKRTITHPYLNKKTVVRAESRLGVAKSIDELDNAFGLYEAAGNAVGMFKIIEQTANDGHWLAFTRRLDAYLEANPEVKVVFDDYVASAQK